MREGAFFEKFAVFDMLHKWRSPKIALATMQETYKVVGPDSSVIWRDVVLELCFTDDSQQCLPIRLPGGGGCFPSTASFAGNRTKKKAF